MVVVLVVTVLVTVVAAARVEVVRLRVRVCVVADVAIDDAAENGNALEYAYTRNETRDLSFGATLIESTCSRTSNLEL